jgi:hypothetical protein
VSFPLRAEISSAVLVPVRASAEVVPVVTAIESPH